MLVYNGVNLASATACLERSQSVLQSSDEAMKTAERTLTSIQQIDGEIASLASNYLCQLVKAIRPTRQIIVGPSHFARLPNEIIAEIFRFLPTPSLLAAGKVCNRWHQITKDKLFYIARNFPDMDIRGYSNEALFLTTRLIKPLNEKIKETKREIDATKDTTVKLFVANGVIIAVSVALLAPYLL